MLARCHFQLTGEREVMICEEQISVGWMAGGGGGGGGAQYGICASVCTMMATEIQPPELTSQRPGMGL